MSRINRNEEALCLIIRVFTSIHTLLTIFPSRALEKQMTLETYSQFSNYFLWNSSSKKINSWRKLLKTANLFWLKQFKHFWTFKCNKKLFFCPSHLSHNEGWKTRWKEESLHIVTGIPLKMLRTNTNEYEQQCSCSKLKKVKNLKY